MLTIGMCFCSQNKQTNKLLCIQILLNNKRRRRRRYNLSVFAIITLSQTTTLYICIHISVSIEGLLLLLCCYWYVVFIVVVVCSQNSTSSSMLFYTLQYLSPPLSLSLQYIIHISHFDKERLWLNGRDHFNEWERMSK